MKRFLIFLALISFVVSFSTKISAQPTSLSDEIAAAKVVSPLPGERCIVCDKKLDSSDPVLMIRGRRVPLVKEALPTFQSEPAKYFAKLQPRAALFTEPIERHSAHWYWLIVGCFALVAVIAIAALGYSLVGRGQNNLRFFGKVLTTSTPSRCSHCDADLHPAAARCPRCGSERVPDYEPEQMRIN